MFLRHFTGALAATSLVVCTCVSLTGCGQKGELYLPAKNGAKEGYLEHKNVKSQYIFGSSSASKKATASEPAATVPNEAPASAPAETKDVTGGSGS